MEFSSTVLLKDSFHLWMIIKLSSLQWLQRTYAFLFWRILQRISLKKISRPICYSRLHTMLYLYLLLTISLNSWLKIKENHIVWFSRLFFVISIYQIYKICIQSRLIFWKRLCLFVYRKCSMEVLLILSPLFRNGHQWVLICLIMLFPNIKPFMSIFRK